MSAARCITLLLACLGASLPNARGAGTNTAALHPPSRLAWWPDARIFASQRSSTNVTVRLPETRPGFRWNEAVLSWNTAQPVGLVIRARPLWGTEPGPWYTLGLWSRDTNVAPRTSVKAQEDADAHVDTDILVLKRPADALEVEVAISGERVPPDLRVGASLLGAEPAVAETGPFKAAWGRTLSLPIRSQAEYPEGINNWCSPTSLSMILGSWADRLGRGDLLQDVRQVARGVHDPAWPGTGNWSFNAAYAGQHPGLSSCVSRLGGIGDLERWIAAGLPVAASVSYAQLKGAANPAAGDGHLVVVSGFLPDGNVQVHDPGVRRERVIRTIPRADFIRAWNHSSRTAYLVWATGTPPPAGGDGRWPEP